MDYFDIYKIILETIKEHDSKNFQELLDDSYKNKKVKNYVDDKNKDNQILVKTFMHTLKNMIDDGLVLGKVIPTKGLTLVQLDGLSTVGYDYLLKLKDDSFGGKLKTALKDEGIPMTPQSLTKFVAKLTL